MGPGGAELGSFPEKISFMSNRTTSKLIIIDVKLFDSGVYKLIANNDYFEEQISVTVLVESNDGELLVRVLLIILTYFVLVIVGKPVIKEINYSDEHRKVKAAYHYICDIFGYPLPDFRWVFKGCINDVKCEESDMEIKVNTFYNIVFYSI